jgi:DNA repair protein RadC
MPRYAYRLETRRVKEDDFPYKTDQFTSPEKVKEFLSVLDTFDNEQMVVLLLDTKNKLCGMCRMSGTVDQTPVYPREIAKHALLSGATAIILAHNHPSGSLTPSGADRDITKRVKAAMELLQIRLHDHFIIGDGGEVYSFAENGLI